MRKSKKHKEDGDISILYYNQENMLSKLFQLEPWEIVDEVEPKHDRLLLDGQK